MCNGVLVTFCYYGFVNIHQSLPLDEKEFILLYSSTIPGVNMSLTPGGVHEVHWQKHADWAYMILKNSRGKFLLFF